MDEKTAELRDIFLSVADGETVTESQQETPGSLVPSDDVEERLVAAVAEMREELDFSTELPLADLVAVVRGFYAGRGDADLAGDIGVSEAAVVRARLDLHLLREADLAVPADLDVVREALEAGANPAALADRFDLDAPTARRCARTLAARAERRRVNDRYRDEFETVLGEPELGERHTDHESGLDEATADQEVDVSF